MAQPNHPFLPGGGEMGQRTRDFDWSSTSLGTVESWSHGLRTAVNIVLQSQFPMFIWWGPELIQFYNDAYRPSMGVDGKHPLALGQRGAECWPEIWSTIYPLIRQVLDGGPSPWFDDQLIPIYRNGRLEDVYWTFSYSALMDDDGSIGGVLVVCNENTKKVQQLQQIKEGQEQLSFALEAGQMGTWDYNPQTNKFTSNNRTKSWFGLEPQDEINLDLAIEAIVETDRERVSTAIQKALQYESGGQYDIKYSIVNKHTGQERIVCAKGHAWFNDQKMAYRLNGTLQDITETETARLQLVQAEEKMRLAIIASDLGTYELILASDEWRTSPRFDAIWGVPRSSSHREGLARIHPDDRVISEKAHKTALSTGRMAYDIRVIHDDGREHWVHLIGSVTYDGHGQPLTILGVIRDIDEQKQFERELTEQVRERTTELQRSNDDLVQFAHVISHDLKEPVRKIKVFTNRAVDEVDPDAPTSRYLQKVLHSADRMSMMIEGVLHYSALSAIKAEMEPVGLDKVVEQITSDLEIVIQQKGARLYCGALPTVMGIPVLLHQLFYNLVNNALKFSGKTENPVIRISLETDSIPTTGFVRISIADNGIGFDPRFSDRIFDAFTRLNSKDQFEGTGLGLALSKKIVQRHGGEITAQGHLEQGATFSFTLPVVA